MNVQVPPDNLALLQRPQPHVRPHRRIVWLAAALVMALAAVTYRYGLPRSVGGIVATAGPLTAELRGPGVLDAINKVSLGPRIAGRLSEVTVDLNDSVVAGQVLARLDPAEFSSQIASAQADADAASRAVEAGRADHERAVATLANARSVYERQTLLLERGTTSQASLDSATASFKQAQADAARTDRVVEQALAEAQSAAAKIGVARAQLNDTVLRAPFDGVVISREHNPGDVLTSGQAVLQLVDPKTVVLTARFDESAIARIQPGQSTRLTFVSQPSMPLGGKVLRLGRSVDEETREFTVDIVPDKLPGNWALGQRGAATVAIEEHSAVISVPKDLLARRDGMPGLWVDVGGRAGWREVELGASDRDRVEVRSGLTAGDFVLRPAGLYRFMPVKRGSGP